MDTSGKPMALSKTNTSSASGSVVPAGCIVLQFQEFIPWNNPDNIVSFQTEDFVRTLKDIVFQPILFLIGAPGNVINMAVFWKQGLKERINVCLFALSLADGLYMLFNVLWIGEQLYLQFTTKEVYGPLLQWLINNRLSGYFGFIWVSQVISAIIASERCFCVIHPIRSHTVLRTSTMTAIIVVIFVVVVGGYFIVSSRYDIACAYDPLSDTTIRMFISGEFYYRYQNLVDILEMFVYGAGLPGVVIVVVMATTIMTTIKLRQAAEWRAKTSSRGSGGDGDNGGMSAQEMALTKMLIWNSVLFVICTCPFAVFRLALFIMPEMNAGGRHHNLFMTCHWITGILSYANSTFNIVIYYSMGSRYRQTLRLLLGRTKLAGGKEAVSIMD